MCINIAGRSRGQVARLIKIIKGQVADFVEIEAKLQG